LKDEDKNLDNKIKNEIGTLNERIDKLDSN
jgi:hypothetical protein